MRSDSAMPRFSVPGLTVVGTERIAVMDDSRTIDRAHAVCVMAKGDASRYPGLPEIELDLAKFHSGRWALQLDRSFARRERPAVILARGVACLAVAWWAQLSPRSYMTRIAGAVLVSPLSMNFGQESIAAQARLGPATRLPFASVVVNAGYPFVEPVLALADSWGSCFIEAASPDDAQPSNRHGGCSDAEAALIALLRAIEGEAALAVEPVSYPQTAVRPLTRIG